MQTLIVAAFVIMCAIAAMAFYLRSHSPYEPGEALRGLRFGMNVGMATSASILFLFALILFHPPTGPGLTWPLVACAIVGNVANLMGVVNCLRELSGESLFAACLLLLNQLLWILYAVRVLLADF
jgi:hypothetical protein